MAVGPPNEEGKTYFPGLLNHDGPRRVISFISLCQ